VLVARPVVVPTGLRCNINKDQHLQSISNPCEQVLIQAQDVEAGMESSPSEGPDLGQVPSCDQSDQASIEKIKSLLQAKDDTQRFVGLALLKSVLDNTVTLRDETERIQELWASIPVKFLDRLLRTGAKPSNANAKDMLDLAISVLHTFALLLPDEGRCESRFTGRIPLLVSSAVHT
jgi:hypothetical protein